VARFALEAALLADSRALMAIAGAIITSLLMNGPAINPDSE